MIKLAPKKKKVFRYVGLALVCGAIVGSVVYALVILIR